MSTASDSTRLAWLGAALGRNHARVRALLAHVRCILGHTGAGGMKSALFTKFLKMLDQVAEAHREETTLINRIEDIEEQHRRCRAHKKLKAANRNESNTNLVPAPDPEATRPKDDAGWWLLMWWLIVDKKKYELNGQQ